MSTSTFDTQATTANHADAHGEAAQPTAFIPVTNSTVHFSGYDYDLKAQIEYTGFLRFEHDIPLGSKILGVKLAIYSASTVGANNFTMRGGFLDPGHARGEWKDANAFNTTNYPRSDDLPHAEWNAGASTDLTVFQDSNYGFSVAWTTVGTAGTDISIADGTLSGYATGTGLVDQFDSYVNDAGVDALRGVGTVQGSGWVPCAIALYRTGTDPGRDEFQAWKSNTTGTTSHRPQLIVEFDPPPAAELASAGTIDAAGTLNTGLLDSEQAAAATLDAAAAVQKPGDAELASDATLDAAAAVQKPGDAELASAAALDAVAILDGLLATELASITTLDAVAILDGLLATELASITTLDAVAILDGLLATELTAAAALDAAAILDGLLATELAAAAALDADGTSTQQPSIGVNPTDILRRPASANMTRRAGSAELTRRDASAELRRRPASANMTRRAGSAELTRRDASAELRRRPASVDI